MKTNRRSVSLASRTRRLGIEPLEYRNLLAGVTFDSVKTFGDGTNPTSVFFGGVVVDDAGNRLVTGYFQGTVDFDPGHSHPGNVDTLQAIGAGENVFVAKYDADGLLSWARGMGSEATQSGENARSFSMKSDDAGDVYVAGTFQATVEFGGISLTSAGGEDVFLAKLTAATGDVAWALRFGDEGWNRLNNDSLAVGADQTAYLASSSELLKDVLKVDTADGAILWQKSFQDVSPQRVVVGGEGDLFLATLYTGPFDADPGPGVHMINHDPSYMNTALLKLDANGDLDWAHVFETSGSNTMTSVLSMAIDGSGNVLLGGYYAGVVDFDPAPGVTASLPSNLNYYVTKFDADGNLAWVHPLIGEIAPTPGELSSYLEIDLSTDSSDNIYATGRFRGVADLDAGDGMVNFSSPAINPNAFASYLTSLTSAGQFRWVTALGNADASVNVFGVAIDSDHGLHLGGSFRGPVDFDPGAGAAQVTSVGLSGFLLTLNPTPGVTVSRTTGLVTREVGTAANFAVTLDAAPTANVTIPVSASDSTEGVTNVSSLVFTPANWHVPQAVQVTGADDGVVDGDVGYTVVLGAAISSDPQYNGLEPADVSVVNLDDDIPATKFYVVDDGSTNKTFEYAESGAALENYAINSANTAPRGAASTVAGDKVWVLDANKKVYVYSPSGALLGSWTAGSLPSNANVQGITTDGTNVWIVDAQSDKVYRYANAASRLSGSQNAASSFSLNSGNKDATDIVTNGTQIWVLNNSSTDKVFRYSVSGSLQGSWTISSAGGSPTGLTIDPTSVSNIWIVDNNSDRVYEFTAAASRTSGSQSPSTSFALAAGNTNPQGIADPPSAMPRASAKASVQAEANDAAIVSILDGWEAHQSMGRGRKR